MNGLYLHIFDFIYILVLICVFFSKKRVKTAETKLFKTLLFLNGFGSVLHVASIFTIINMNIIRSK